MKTTSPLDQHRTKIEQWVSENWSNSDIAAALAEFGVPTSDRSIRRALRRWGIERPPGVERPGLKVDGDEAEVTSPASSGFTTPEDLMKERGLDPKEWEVAGMTVNEWDSPTGDILRQLKLQLRRLKPINLIAPARIDGPTIQPNLTKRSSRESLRIVLVGDQQAPFHELDLHRVFIDFLGWYKPQQGVLMGDTADFSDISRHPRNPERDATVQECVDAAYSVLRDYRMAHPATHWKKLAGNHDERIRRMQVDRIEQVYGVRRALIPGESAETPVLDIEHLLRLDELGIDYIRPNGDYEHTQINLSTHLAARHGWIARKGSGASALATLEHLGFSVVVGHTHRQSLVHKTRHDISGQLTTLAACETGCMCRIEEGLGYAVAPDWQNGCATAEIWPDGTFKLDLATYVNGTLYYRDQRFS